MAMSDKMPSMEEMTKSLMEDRKMSKPKTEEGSLVAREVEVAGAFEEELLKKFRKAVEGGYRGTFEEFLIDQMKLGFEDETMMRVSELPEGIMQLMNMMKDRKTA